MLTRKADTSTRCSSPAPSLARMSRMFSITARVWARISRLTVPMASADAPATLLSGRRELVPETTRKSPARLLWGTDPRGVALTVTTRAVLVVLMLGPSKLNLDADGADFRIEVQRVAAAFASQT